MEKRAIVHPDVTPSDESGVPVEQPAVLPMSDPKAVQQLQQCLEKEAADAAQQRLQQSRED